MGRSLVLRLTCLRFDNFGRCNSAVDDYCRMDRMCWKSFPADASFDSFATVDGESYFESVMTEDVVHSFRDSGGDC